MPDEVNYVGRLLELEEALSSLPGIEAHITNVAYTHWRETVEIEEIRKRMVGGGSDGRQPPSWRNSTRRDAARVSNPEPRVSTAN